MSAQLEVLSNERPTKTLELTPRQIDEITEFFAILELFVALQASQHFLFEGPHCAAHPCTAASSAGYAHAQDTRASTKHVFVAPRLIHRV
jgi:hypothetical protein